MSYDSYLAHHGIKGMHWGVRRYQNPDGSLKHPKKSIGQRVSDHHQWRKNASRLREDGAIIVSACLAGMGTVGVLAALNWN